MKIFVIDIVLFPYHQDTLDIFKSILRFYIKVSAGYLQCMKSDFFSLQCIAVSDCSSFLCCPQVDKLEEAESQRKTEEEVTEPQPMVFGRFTGSKSP